MGTPAFCAQEQARGRWDEVDHRTDLYSVGASLFTCITGVHVHEAETSSEQLALAIGATARSLALVMPHAPKELVDLVDTALSYDKEDRFQSARAMRAAVRRVIAGLPVEIKISTPPPPSGVRTFGPNELDPDSMPPARMQESHSSTRIAAGILAAAFLAVLIFFLSSPGRPEMEAAEGLPSDRSSGEKTTSPNPESQPPRPEEDSTAPEPDEVDELIDEEDKEVPPANGASPSAAAPRGPAAPSTAKPQVPSQASQPTPRASGVSASFPPPSSAPSPDSGSSDEDMFNKRF